MIAARSAQWLLLDVPGSPQAGWSLQQRFADVPCYALFESTDLHALRDQGPQLIELSAQSPLMQCCHDEPADWPGLLLVSSASPEQLLGHLRRMLTVTFGLHYKGLLSYYNPFIASYFFDASDARELSRWLGPIDKLYWHGGTWEDRAIGSLGWLHLVNPRLAVSELAIEDSLSLRQQNKLQTCLLERHAWHWSRSTGHDFGTIWSFVQEGLEQGFSEQTVLDGWLRLRLQYPSATPEEHLPGRTQQERLDSLRNRWQSHRS
ncbi:DUF4123 domain-containing protein [Pseudomonas sp. CVAP|uniref:DUF4123 domain-containing protein n=1 Tax=Pseudomonas sp. CVAP\|nr:DUF4123 domain-containing protein [Pseudomonas sp. CVAP\